jgi:4-amino-4-deoxy-L-arabinose transferase-like glycosyltransferase
MAPSYPLGLPLHLVAFSWIAGLDWATIPLNICSALAAGALCYLLARRLDLPRSAGFAGAAVLLFCPMFLFAAIQPMSDLLALTWTLAALYAALRAREGWRWGVACGIAIAVAVLTRPTDLLVVIPVVVALGLGWRSYLWVGLGGLPGAVLLGFYNREIYGSAFSTGYGDIWSAFSREFAAHNFPFFARWIPGLLTPLVLAVLLAPFRTIARRREIAVLGLWAGILIGFYAFYYHSGETWWYLRFILPAFPALILIGLVVLNSFAATATTRKTVGTLLLVFALGWEITLCRRFDLIYNKSGEATYHDAAAWGRTHLPADAVIICMQVSGAMYYYTNFLLLRWDQIDLSKLPRLVAALGEAHRPVYAVLYEFEEADARERMGGRWKKIAKVRNATIWQVELPAAP